LVLATQDFIIFKILGKAHLNEDLSETVYLFSVQSMLKLLVSPIGQLMLTSGLKRRET